MATQTQPKGEAVRPYQPGDRVVYRLNAKLEGTNPTNGEKLNIPMTGTRTITILPQKYKSPKGVMLLQRKQVVTREATIQGQPRKETSTEIVLINYGKEGEEQIYGIIENNTPQWAQTEKGYYVSGFGSIFIGMTFDTGEMKIGSRTRSAKFTVKRKEKVTVPTGTYDAYVCEGTAYDSRSGNSEATMWVVPKIGTVKTHFKSDQGSMKLEMTTELIEVKLQKKPAEPVKPAQPRKAPPKTSKSKPKK